MHNLKPWKISVIYWIPPLFISAVLFSNPEIRFDTPERMILVMDPSYISVRGYLI